MQRRTKRLVMAGAALVLAAVVIAGAAHYLRSGPGRRPEDDVGQGPLSLCPRLGFGPAIHGRYFAPAPDAAAPGRPDRPNGVCPALRAEPVAARAYLRSSPRRVKLLSLTPIGPADGACVTLAISPFRRLTAPLRGPKLCWSPQPHRVRHELRPPALAIPARHLGRLRLATSSRAKDTSADTGSTLRQPFFDRLQHGGGVGEPILG